MFGYLNPLLVIGCLFFSNLHARAPGDMSNTGPGSTESAMRELVAKAEACLPDLADSCLMVAEKLLLKYPAALDSVNDLIIRAVRQLRPDRADSNRQDRKTAFALMENDRTERIYAYVYIGSDLFDLEKYNLSEIYFTRALRLSRSFPQEEMTAYCMSSLGTIRFMKSDFEAALGNHLDALKIYKRTQKEDLIASGYYSIGSDYSALCYYDRAIEYYLRALDIYEKMERSESIAMVYHAIGLVYEDIGNLNRAFEYNMKALSLVEKSDWEIHASILKWLGTLYILKGQLQKAEEHLYMAMNIEAEKKSHVGLAVTMVKLGEVYFQRKELDRAYDFCRKARAVASGFEPHWVEIRIHDLLGRIYLAYGNVDRAEYHLKQALKLSNRLKLRDMTMDVYASLTDLFQRSGDMGRAYRYLKSYNALRDSIHTGNTHSIADMQLRYEKDKREKENQILRQNVAIKELELEKRTLIQAIQLLLLILFLALFGWLLYRFRLKHRLTQSLTARIDETIERHREQQQIIIHQAGLSSLGELAASIIHDILQPIQNIRLTAESVALKTRPGAGVPAEIRALMDEIREDVVRAEKIVKHIKIFAKKNKQTNNDKFDVNESIRDAILVTRRQFKSQKISVATELDEQLPLVSGNHYNFEQIVINLLLNARDAIYQKRTQNAMMPGQINIETETTGEAIKLRLADNGSGMPDQIRVNIFKPFFTTKNTGVGTGLGLMIVHKMIKDMGGKIEYQSTQNKGTTVLISLPLNKKDRIIERMYIESN